MYSEKSAMRASHRPAAFCAFRPLLLVPFVALCPSIGNLSRFVKKFCDAGQDFSDFPTTKTDLFTQSCFYTLYGKAEKMN